MSRTVGHFSLRTVKQTYFKVNSVVPNQLGVDWSPQGSAQSSVSSVAGKPHGGMTLWDPSTWTRWVVTSPKNDEIVFTLLFFHIKAGNQTCTLQPLFKAGGLKHCHLIKPDSSRWFT